jgi:beta-galactosidase
MPKSRRAIAAAAPVETGEGARVRLVPGGIELAGEVVPLVAGAMHYWRHATVDWGPCLDAMRSMGFRLVDTYVPWAVHEVEPGSFDFGQKNPRLDVARFLRLAQERGLHAVVRPGPHVNAELTYFGLPERVVWDRECQARTPRQNPVMLPMVPVAFPVPSYASGVFLGEVEAWFDAACEVLAPLRWPDGPIVLVQVDNEGALYFRDGPYDQDYHSDAIAMFRAFMRQKYKTVGALREAWREPILTFANVEPPHRFEAKHADELASHMDWMEFHEHLLATSMERMAKAIARAGLDGVPTTHNFPLGEAATPLNPSRVATAVDLVGLDYYHRATPTEHMTILRRTSELVSRCEGRRLPAFGAEVGAGFPPFFAPLDEKDSLYTLMCALAYGLRGMNVYMAVERDRWVGAPVDPHGRPRPFAQAYRALFEALERTSFHLLRRRAPVRLVVSRSLRRLARAAHAFGPVTPALFNILGVGMRESCLEDDLGFELGQSPMAAGEAYVRAFERALTARGVPFAYAGGETLEWSVDGASWVVAATAGGVKREFFASLRALRKDGIVVTIGPTVPDRDGSMRRMDTPHDARGLEVEPLDDVARADALVARRIEELSLPTYPVDPPDAYASVHEDASGAPRVVFLMNPTAADVLAKVSVPGAGKLVDLLKGDTVVRAAGAFEVTVESRSVRMFEVGG